MIMDKKLVLKKDIITAFHELGVEKGQNIEVHTSLSSLGFVCGGPQMVIEALIESVGEEGTIMMPTQTWKNLDPTTGVHWEEPEEWWQGRCTRSSRTRCSRAYRKTSSLPHCRCRQPHTSSRASGAWDKHPCTCRNGCSGDSSPHSGC